MAGFTTSFAKALACLTLGTMVFTSCDEVIDEVMDDILVESISVSPTSKSMLEGDTATLTATITPSNALIQTVTWSSSDETVATVADGEVTAIAAGEATITVKSVDGGYTATCAITVSADYVAVTSIEMSSPTLTIKEGQTDTLTVAVLPADATYQSVTWSSSDEAVATVVDGVVTAVAEGEATITATSDDEDAAIDPVTCAVTVESSYVALTSLAFDQDVTSGLEIMATMTDTLTVTIAPADATCQTVTWKSSDEAVATVVDGVITAVAAGDATITATSDDEKAETPLVATCEVKVTAFQATLVTAITLSQGGTDLTSDSVVDITEGGTVTLVATATPATATDSSVTWSIALDEGYTEEDITIDSETGVVSGVTLGATATVTATAADESGVTATCKVKVVEAAAVSGLETIGDILSLLEFNSESSVVINATEDVTFYAIMTSSTLSNNVLNGYVALHGYDDAEGTTISTTMKNGLHLAGCSKTNFQAISETINSSKES